MTKFKIGDNVLFEGEEYIIKVSQKNHATGVIRYQLEGFSQELINEDRIEVIPNKENAKAKRQFAKDLIKMEEEKEERQIFEDLPKFDEDNPNQENGSKPLKRTKNK